MRLQLCLLSQWSSAVAQNAPGVAPSIFNRAMADFKNAHIMEAASGSIKLQSLFPIRRHNSGSVASRSIYAGRYQDCREQFESHRTVNPDDVENAAWHFLCVARASLRRKRKRRFCQSVLIAGRPCGRST